MQGMYACRSAPKLRSREASARKQVKPEAPTPDAFGKPPSRAVETARDEQASTPPPRRRRCGQDLPFGNEEARKDGKLPLQPSRLSLFGTLPYTGRATIR